MSTIGIIPYLDETTRRPAKAWIERFLRHRLDHVHVAEQTETGRFNKSRLINAATVDASDDDILVISDADCFVADWSLRKAIDLARFRGDLVRPHNSVCYTTEAERNQILRRDPRAPSRGNWLRHRRKSYAAPGGVWVIRVGVFREAGGMDERFQGWGGEDNEFIARTGSLVMPGPLYHMWHRPAVDRKRNPQTKRLYRKLQRETMPKRKTTVTTIVPFRDCQQRRPGLEWVRRYYAARTDDVIVSECPAEGPWNKSRMVNQAAEESDSDVLVIADADCVVCDWSLGEAIRLAGEGMFASPHNCICYTSPRQKAELLGFDPGQPVRGRWFRNTRTWVRAWGGLWVIPREMFQAVGGMDEGFWGWGWQDVAFQCRVREHHGKPFRRLAGPLFHLYHDSNEGCVMRKYNEQYFHRYYRRVEP